MLPCRYNDCSHRLRYGEPSLGGEGVREGRRDRRGYRRAGRGAGGGGRGAARGGGVRHGDGASAGGGPGCRHQGRGRRRQAIPRHLPGAAVALQRERGVRPGTRAGHPAGPRGAFLPERRARRGEDSAHGLERHREAPASPRAGGRAGRQLCLFRPLLLRGAGGTVGDRHHHRIRRAAVRLVGRDRPPIRLPVPPGKIRRSWAAHPAQLRPHRRRREG